MPRGHFALKLFFYPNDSSSERFCWKFWASFSGYTSIVRDQGYTNFSNFNLSLFDPSCRSKRLSDRSSKMNLLSILCSQTGASGGGQVVSMLAFYSDNPSSNPAEAYSFFCKIVFEKVENKQKRPGLAHVLKTDASHLFESRLYSYLGTSRFRFNWSLWLHQSKVYKNLWNEAKRAKFLNNVTVKCSHHLLNNFHLHTLFTTSEIFAWTFVIKRRNGT